MGKKVYKYGINGDGDKSAWVCVKFVGLSKKQMGHLFKAEKELRKAGVSFDTGYDFGTKTRDWQCDWALRGARMNIVKKQKGDK